MTEVRRNHCLGEHAIYLLPFQWTLWLLHRSHIFSNIIYTKAHVQKSPSQPRGCVGSSCSSIIGEIHNALVHEVCQYGRGSKETIGLGIGGIKPFHEPLKSTLQTTNVPFYSHIVDDMHLVVCAKCSLAHILRLFILPSLCVMSMFSPM